VAAEPAHDHEDLGDDGLLPAWSLPAAAAPDLSAARQWPGSLDREWAWGGSTGAGVRVCIVDSGIEADHPRIGGVARAVAIAVDDDGQVIVTEDEEGDLCGHGTACAGVIRSIAPDCELHSVRVLGAGFTGSGPVLLAGLHWALKEGYEVVNMSLSTTKSQFAGTLHDLADSAYFKRSLIVASAHNMPVASYPWRFSSVISVGSHDSPDPLRYYWNPSPPVEVFAHGVDVEVAWVGGTRVRSTGNSFATPHISAIAALILGKHPGLAPFEVKNLLYLTADNVVADGAARRGDAETAP
jgi:subtilisin family serine protease